jgi:hypothetical protein
MSESSTIQREREDARAGKSPSTQAGEFVREEFHHIREGKHGARSTKQTIAIGLSKARRRSRATLGALRREGRQLASPLEISRQTHAAARRRTSAERSAAAQKAVRTKGHEALVTAGRKTARTRMPR